MQKEKNKVSDFKVFDRIAEENNPDGIAMFPDLIEERLTSKGGEITFGIPAAAMQWHFAGSHYLILYAIKKEDFARIKSELENETK